MTAETKPELPALLRLRCWSKVRKTELGAGAHLDIGPSGAPRPRSFLPH